MKTKLLVALILIISTIDSKANDFDEIREKFIQMKKLPVIPSDKAVILCIAESTTEPELLEKKFKGDFQSSKAKLINESKKNRPHSTPKLLK